MQPILSRFAAITTLGALLISSGLSPYSYADITGLNPEEPHFIQITLTEQARLRFELCEVASPTACQAIGERDYTLEELQAKRESLLQEAEKSGKFGARDVLSVILMSVLGAAGGGFGGGLAGLAVGSAISPGSKLGLTLAGKFGLAGMAIVSGVTGVLTVRWLRKKKRKKRDDLQRKASLLREEVLADQPVQTQERVSEIARALDDVLKTLPSQAAHGP